MNNTRRTAYMLITVAGIAGLRASPATAQVDVFWIPTGTADYTDAGNWTGGFVPESFVDERAIIDNGGTAFVATSALPPSAVILGLTAGNDGTLEIRNGGHLPVEFLQGNVGNGGVAVGAAGTGTLRVLPGGTLNADGPLISGANAANSIVLGGAAAGTATVQVGSASFAGTTQIFPNVNFSSAGQIAFQSASAYHVQITAAGSPTLHASLSTIMGGSLNVDFSGVTPSVGSSWELFQAGGFAGSFDAINVTGAPPLGPGQRYAVNVLPVAPNRVRGVLELEQFLQLNVDRDTGAVTLANAGGQPFGIQAYTILSAAGSLSPTGWNSLDAQNALGGDWRESNPTTERLSELKASGVGTLTGASGASLGAAFAPSPTEFGQQVEDLTFQYVKADGSLATGVVNYTGSKVNNLLLTVDPTTGEAQLKNTSPFSVAIDGYTIFSESGSLSSTGWNSLDDQNAAGGNWRESPPTAFRLSELKPTGATSLTPGMSFDLGNPFVAGETEDLDFLFHIAGQGDLRGVVVYGEISAGIPGDHNGDGVVDAADYVFWRKTGINAQQGYAEWRANFGQTSGSGVALANAAAAAVPEPHSLSLFIVALAGLWAARIRLL